MYITDVHVNVHYNLLFATELRNTAQNIHGLHLGPEGYITGYFLVDFQAPLAYSAHRR